MQIFGRWIAVEGLQLSSDAPGSHPQAPCGLAGLWSLTDSNHAHAGCYEPIARDGHLVDIISLPAPNKTPESSSATMLSNLTPR